MPNAQSVRWTHEHFLIALNLYCKLPFGKLDRNTPLIRTVAAKMGRTANSLAMQLGNFAALDPVQKALGKKGLSGVSANARAAWEEYFSDLDRFAPISEGLLADLLAGDDTRAGIVEEVPVPAGPERTTETEAIRKERRDQQFFRLAVLTAYGERCCVSGISVTGLLIASHIVPWRASVQHRLDLHNGLCLSAMHDAAFDHGLITFDQDFRMVLGRELKSAVTHEALRLNFQQYEGRPIRLPDKLAEPSEEHLAYHRQHVFLG